MSVPVDLQSQLLQYIKAMKKPLLFVAKNDYASIGAVKDLGPTLVTVLEKALELPFSASQKELLATVKGAFLAYETQALEAKIASIATGLQSLRDLERLLSAPVPAPRVDKAESTSPTLSKAAPTSRQASSRPEDRTSPPKDRSPQARSRDEGNARTEGARQEGSEDRRRPDAAESTRDDSTRRTDKNRDTKSAGPREGRAPTPAPARVSQKTEQRPAEKLFQSAPYRERGDQDPSWGRVRREAAPELEPLFFLPLPFEEEAAVDASDSPAPVQPREPAPRMHRGRDPQRSREGRGMSESGHERRGSERPRQALPRSGAPSAGDQDTASESAQERTRGPAGGMGRRRPAGPGMPSRVEAPRPASHPRHRVWSLPEDLVPFEELIDEYVPANVRSRFGLPVELEAELLSERANTVASSDDFSADGSQQDTDSELLSSALEHDAHAHSELALDGELDSTLNHASTQPDASDEDLLAESDDDSLLGSGDADLDGSDSDEAEEDDSSPDPELFFGTPAQPMSRSSLDLDVEPPDLDELRNFDGIPAADDLPSDDSSFADPDAPDVNSDEEDSDEDAAELDSSDDDTSDDDSSDDDTSDDDSSDDDSADDDSADDDSADDDSSDDDRDEDDGAPEVGEEGSAESFAAFPYSNQDSEASTEAEGSSSQRSEASSSLRPAPVDSEDTEASDASAFLGELNDDLTIHEVLAEVVERAAWGTGDASQSDTEPGLDTPLTGASTSRHLLSSPPASELEDDRALASAEEVDRAADSSLDADADPRGMAAEDESDDDGASASPEGDSSGSADAQGGDGEDDDGDASDAGAAEGGSDETRRRGRRRRRRRKGGGEGDATAPVTAASTREANPSGLATPLSEVPAIGPRLGAILEQQGLKRIQDLLYFFPRSWVDRRLMHTIRDLTPGMHAVFQATIDPAEVTYSEQGRLLEVRLVDLTGSVMARWPNVRSNYLRNRFRQGAVTIVSGQVEDLEGEAVLINPEVEILGSEEDDGVSTGRIVPLYPPLEGLGQKTLRRLIHQLLTLEDAAYADPIPAVIRQRQQLRALGDALLEIHFPPDSTQMDDLEKHQTPAWKTLAFHRLMALQLGLAARRKVLAREPGRPVVPLHAMCSRLLKRLPALTDDQRLALEDIKRDMLVPHPMARLLHAESRWRALEVAAGAIALALESGAQAAFIVPNELLVEQYAEALSGLLKPIKIELEVLTGSTRGKPREKVLGRLRKGEARCVLGTHVLLQDGVQFRNLGLVVLDEHRRMGMLQRRQLFRRGVVPDLLVLAADPMPRVILQSVYGDITWSTLQGMGRDNTPIHTQMVVAENREECEVAIRSLLTQGRQIYYVSPEPTESATPSTQRLADLATRLGEEVFPGTPVGWLHSRMPSADQEDTLKRFRLGQIKVLVTCSEPDLRLRSSNAAVMVIERADQLGLVETHAIRSLLTHSFYPATCYLVPSPAALPEDVELLRQLEKETDGMTLAELELQSSGVPDALGIRQLNLTASISADLVLHGDLMDVARTEAFRWMDDCPDAENAELHRPLMEFARHQWPQLFEASAS